MAGKNFVSYGDAETLMSEAAATPPLLRVRRRSGMRSHPPRRKDL